MLKPSRFLSVGLAILAVFPFSTSSPASAISPVLITNVPGYFNDLAVSGNHLFAANHNTSPNSGLRIFDISNPAAPLDVGYNDGKGSVTALAVSDNYLFVVYPEGLSILDISSPTKPNLVGQIPGDYTALSVSDHHAYLTSRSGGSVSAYDVSNVANPVNFATLSGSPVGTAATGNYLYWFDSGVSVYDFSNPVMPTKYGPFNGIWGFAAAISGDYAFLADGTNSFFILNISTRTNPVAVYNSGYQLYWSSGVRVSGNYAFELTEEPGAEAQILDVSNPTNAFAAGTMSVNSFAPTIVVSGNYAFLAGVLQMNVFSLGLPSPQLSITPNSNTLLLSWATPNIGFAVQQNPDLNARNWITLTNLPVVVGSQNQVTIVRPKGTMFYRLVAH